LGTTQAPIQCVPGSVLGIKWLGHDVDHSPPFNAEVKIECSHTLLPLYAFMAWTGTT